MQQSLKSALDILISFTLSPSQGVSEIARNLGLSKSKVSRVLSTLSTANFVVKSEDNGKYRLGPMVLSLSTSYLARIDIRSAALPHLEHLAKITNETVDLFILSGAHRICLEQRTSSQEIRIAAKPGEHLPLHAGAAGKLLLAYLPHERRDELLTSMEMTKFTSRTITNRGVLEKELTKIVRKGFALSYYERTPWAVSISVPIRDHTGSVAAALSVSAPVMRTTQKQLEYYKSQAITAADKISWELGYSAGDKTLGGTNLSLRKTRE